MCSMSKEKLIKKMNLRKFVAFCVHFDASGDGRVIFPRMKVNYEEGWICQVYTTVKKDLLNC